MRILRYLSNLQYGVHCFRIAITASVLTAFLGHVSAHVPSAQSIGSEFDDFIQHRPLSGRSPSQRTSYSVDVTGQDLVVVVRCDDTEPQLIRAPLQRHDRIKPTEDYVTVYLDGQGSRRSAQFFRANAAGSTADGIYRGGSDLEDLSPDFRWSVKVDRDERGYSATFRIPLTSIRDSGQTQVTWRLMVDRNLPREIQELVTSVSVPRGAISYISVMPKADITLSPESTKHWEAVGTIVGRRYEARNSGGRDEYDLHSRGSFDIKWKPSGDLVLDATIKPDFSQVEIDTPKLSHNNRFSLLLQEKRAFFQESIDLLQSPTDALYTRSVNMPAWGVRASWRAERAGGMMMAFKDRGGGVVLIPGRYYNDFVAQPENKGFMARGSLEEQHFGVGALAAGRDYGELGLNAVFGVDARYEIVPGWRLSAQAMESQTTALHDPAAGRFKKSPESISGGKVYVNLLGRTSRTESEVTFERSSDGFRNDSGFVAQVGVNRWHGKQSVIWEQIGPANLVSASLIAERVTSEAHAEAISSLLGPGVWVSTSNNTEVEVRYVRSSFRSDPSASAVRERYWTLWGQRTIASWLPLAEAWADIGKIGDVQSGVARSGRRLGASLRLRPYARWELEPRYEVLTLDGLQGVAHRETAGRVLSVYHLGAGASLRWISQLSSLERRSERAKTSETAHSLTFAWRSDHKTQLYAGVARGDTRDGMQQFMKGTEVFVKLQIDLGGALAFIRR